MNFKKITLTLACGGFAVAAMGQGLSGRFFSYDGSNYTNGNVTYIVNGDAPNANVWSGYNPGTVYGQNGVLNASATNAGFLALTLINVATYVYISGNFGGVYNVTGFGAAQDTHTYNNDVEIRTNRSLSFTATGFYGIGAAIGSINYTISLFQDYPSNGVPIGPALTGTDAGFNGATLGLNAITSLPVDGKATLRLSRNLTLTQAAQGGQQYTAGGYIQVGVN